jgi:hypothetical protein
MLNIGIIGLSKTQSRSLPPKSQLHDRLNRFEYSRLYFHRSSMTPKTAPKPSLLPEHFAFKSIHG